MDPCGGLAFDVIMTDQSVIKCSKTMKSSRPANKPKGEKLTSPGATGRTPAPVPKERVAAPASKPREARSAARREAILAAALDEFSARGFEAARLDDVAKRAGIAKGTIYLYFRDKETLFQELLRAMLTPLVARIEALGQLDVSARQLAENFVDVFVREVYGTKRQEVVRLIITEGRRFPKLAEFYYREVLSRIVEAVRGVLKRAALRANARGEVPAALIEFPQLLAAPGLVVIIWGGLFDRFEPLDVRKMMTAHIDLLFAPQRTPEGAPQGGHHEK